MYCSHAEEEESIKPGIVDGDISDVKTFGEWEDGEDEGFYRLIVYTFGGDPNGSRYYLQWVKSELYEYSEVIHSVEIKELSHHTIFRGVKVSKNGELIIDYISRAYVFGTNPQGKVNEGAKVLPKKGFKYEFTYFTTRIEKKD